MAHSTDSDSDFVSTAVPTKKVQTNATVRKTGKEIYIDIDSASQDRVKKAKNTKKKKILEKKKRHYVSDSSSLQSETSESETSTTDSDEYDDESDEEIYVKKRTGDRKYVEGVTKIKEAKRKRNNRDNRAAV
ncbi:unnamed protein product [Lactuca saligna]|uniref:Uncharacterized protein n=1 Tax=Lactuca saligna TaxID=75948 RepID=A0AA35VK53_LACSI|nr:unnamed protein product [Lactuca saligna]